MRLFQRGYLLRDLSPIVVPGGRDLDLGILELEASSSLVVTTVANPVGPEPDRASVYVIDESRESVVEVHVGRIGPRQRPPLLPAGSYWVLALPGEPEPDAWRSHVHRSQRVELLPGESLEVTIDVLD